MTVIVTVATGCGSLQPVRPLIAMPTMRGGRRALPACAARMGGRVLRLGTADCNAAFGTSYLKNSVICGAASAPFGMLATPVAFIVSESMLRWS